jgi:uncharacterized protein (TIGR02145 family)
MIKDFTVTFDGREYETTEGKVMIPNLENGVYDVGISAPGFECDSAKITIAGENKYFEFELVKQFSPPPIPSVIIGNLEWMKRNLDIEVPNSLYYNNDPALGEIYGRLYTWDAAVAAAAMVGDGWRLPTQADFNDLVAAAGGTNIAGRALKASPPDWDGDDSFGFTALPGGFANQDDSSDGIGTYGRWWYATEYHIPAFDRVDAWALHLEVGDDVAHDTWRRKGMGYSVRLCREPLQ